MTMQIYCHSCGKQLVPNSAFCNTCGAAIKLVSEQSAKTAAGTILQELTATKGLTPDSASGLPADQVLFQIRPAFYEVGAAYVMAALLSLLSAGVIGIFFGWHLQVVLILAVIFFLFPVYKHIQRNRVVYTLTPNKIEIDSGLFSKTTRNIPLRNIQDVTTSATIGQRLIGLGDVIIDSASDAGKITMRNIRNPRRYADLVLAQLHRWN